MDTVDKFFTVKDKLFAYFGLPVEWIELPFDDARSYYWRVSDSVVEYSEEETFEDDSCLYRDDIYTQRFFPKHVYRGKDYTLIFCDPHVDGCKWWRIFANELERKWEQ